MTAAHEKVERNAKIYQLYLDGVTQADIGRQYGLCNQRVCDIIHLIRHRNGDQPRPRPQKPQKPVQKPARRPKRRKRDPTYMRELKRRQRGGDRYWEMYKTARVYTHPISGSRLAA